MLDPLIDPLIERQLAQLSTGAIQRYVAAVIRVAADRLSPGELRATIRLGAPDALNPGDCLLCGEAVLVPHQCTTHTPKEPTMTAYKLDSKCSLAGTHLCGYVKADYLQLVELLGKPNSPGDDYKVSTEWQFEGPGGEPIALYDWKETNLYEEMCPSVEQWRDAAFGYEWHIGARSKDDADAFRIWLKNELREED